MSRMYGKPVEMVVDRTIHAEFSADWFVRVRDYQSKQVVCEATGGGQYLPDAEMPSPVTLEWWAYTEPRCAGPNLQPGTYVVETTWRVDPPDPRLPVVSLSVRSNPFQVLPLDVPAETVDRYRGVQQQIEMLQEEIKQMKGDDE